MTCKHTEVTKMTTVCIARVSVDIFKVYGETVTNFGFITSVISLSRLKSPYVALCSLKSPIVALNRLKSQYFN